MSAAAEVDSERAERESQAGDVLARLPDYVREPSSEVLLTRMQHVTIRGFATKATGATSALVIAAGRPGKTTALAYLFRRLLARGVRAGGAAWTLAQGMRWTSASDIEAAARDGKGRSRAPSAELVGATLLFVDDLGFDRFGTAVTSILHSRHDRGRHTIAATSRPRDQLEAKYSDDVVARLCKPPTGMLVDTTGVPAR